MLDVEADVRHGTGFTSKSYTGDSLLECLDNARKHYKEAGDWRTIAMRCMKQDFSWQATAEAYMKAYRRVTRRVKAQPVDD